MMDLKVLENLLTQGKITRREFLAKVSALSLATAVSPALLKTSASAATPKRGGLVRAAHSSQSPGETLDPSLWNAGIDYCRGLQFYNPLVWVSDTLEPVPELAESFEAEPDAKTWYFKLRKGIKFSNGKVFGAKDVVYTISRLIAEGSKSPAKTIFAGIKEIAADGKHVVKVTLKQPNADLPVLFSTFQAMILPDGFTDFKNPVGTGPFLLKEFKPGVRSVAVRKPDYWKEGKPYIDQLEWFAITDGVARANALMAGDIQLMLSLDPKLIKKIEQTSGVTPVSTKAGQFVDFVMMCDREPTNNHDVRMGFKYLMDREKVLKSIYKGHGMVGNDHYISPIDRFYCDKLPIRPCDPDKAKYHFKKAGAENLAIDLYVSEAAGSGAVELTLMMQQSAAQIGIKVNIKRVPSAGYWSSTWGKFPFFMSGWNMRPTTDMMLTLAFKSDSSWNEGKYKSEKFDKILIAARGELDENKRQEMYCEAQTMIHNDAGIIIPSFINYIDAISEKVKGFEKNPLAGLGGLRFHETIWLES